MPLMNRLYDAVSRDSEFLMSTLRPAAEFDDFTAHLLKIYDEVKDCQNGDVTLGIHRSDYMFDEPSGRLLQVRLFAGVFDFVRWLCSKVELNTIASSFGCLGSQVSKMHSYLLSTVKELPPWVSYHFLQQAHLESPSCRCERSGEWQRIVRKKRLPKL